MSDSVPINALDLSGLPMRPCPPHRVPTVRTGTAILADAAMPLAVAGEPSAALPVPDSGPPVLSFLTNLGASR